MLIWLSAEGELSMELKYFHNSCAAVFVCMGFIDTFLLQQSKNIKFNLSNNLLLHWTEFAIAYFQDYVGLIIEAADPDISCTDTWFKDTVMIRAGYGATLAPHSACYSVVFTASIYVSKDALVNISDFQESTEQDGTDTAHWDRCLPTFMVNNDLIIGFNESLKIACCTYLHFLATVVDRLDKIMHLQHTHY